MSSQFALPDNMHKSTEGGDTDSLSDCAMSHHIFWQIFVNSLKKCIHKLLRIFFENFRASVVSLSLISITLLPHVLCKLN